MSRIARLWLWLWTEAVMFAAASVLPARDADAVEAWCLRLRRPRPWCPPTPPVIAAEGDTPASVEARREALIRLHRELHRPAASPPLPPKGGATDGPRATDDPH